MTRRLTIVVLASRALTALMTVWCLGCSAYEPVLDAMLGSPVADGMSCGSEISAAASAADHGGLSVSSSPGDPGDTGYACACGSCYSASPLSGDIVVAKPRSPSVVGRTILRLVSVTRAPIAPPPEARTL